MVPMDLSTDAQLQELMSHSAWLRRLARTLVRDAAAVDDLLQETWLAALKNPPDPNRPARPWLAGVIRRLAAMRTRGEARRVHRQRSTARGEGVPSTAELVEGVDTQRRIAEAVLDLEEPYRTTLLLRFYEQLSSVDIAKRQGIPSATVRWRLRRGLEQLRERLDSLWSDRRSWCTALLVFEQRANPSSESSPPSADVLTSPSLPFSLAGSSVWVPWFGLVLLAVATFTVRAWNERSDPVYAASVDGLAPSNPGSPSDPKSQPLVDASSVGPTRSSLVSQANPRAGRQLARTGAAQRRGLQIVHPDGSDGSALRVVALAPRGELQAGETDANGRFDLGELEPPLVLYVKRPAAFLQRFSLEGDSNRDSVGDFRVELPSGSEVAGRVSIDGRAPSHSISLSLTRDQPLFGDEDAPLAVRDHIRSARIAHCKTDSHGSFRFVGLEPDWHGALRVADGYRFDQHAEPSERSISLSGPASGLSFDLHLEGGFTGRTIGLDDRPQQSTLMCTFDCGANRPKKTLTLQTEADGSFRIPPHGAFEELWVRAEAGDALGFLRVESETGLPGRGDPRELGEIHLVLAREIVIEARSAMGGLPRLLETGAALTGGRVLWPGTPEAAGRVRVRLPSDFRGELVVQSAGHHTERLPIPASDRIAWTLEPSADLEVRFLDAGGAPRPAARLRVQSLSSEAFHARVVRGQVSSKEALTGDAVYRADREGMLWLSGLDGDEPLVLEETDPLGNAWSRRRVLLQGAQLHALEFRCEGARSTFSGAVFDDSGAPIVGAAIHITGPAGTAWNSRTDREGRFRLVHAQLDPVRIEVRKTGFATSVLENVRLVDRPVLELNLRAE